MFKRIMLWFGMNIAIMIVITITFSILEQVFWIPISTHTGWYLSMLIWAAVIWFMWSFISLSLSKWMAKRAYKITPITIDQVSDLWSKEKLVWDTISDLSERNKIKMPEVWIYNDNEANAFATWSSKNNSLVAVSGWLLNSMDKDAIEWVVAHEMAHIINGDMVTMALLQWVLNTFVVFISNILTNLVETFLDEKMWFFARLGTVIFFQIMLWVLASLVAMKFSRYREFRADAWSAKFVGKDKMIAWLRALKNMENMVRWDDSNLAAMKISSKKQTWIRALLSSHPDIDDRIKALEELRI